MTKDQSDKGGKSIRKNESGERRSTGGEYIKKDRQNERRVIDTLPPPSQKPVKK